MSTVAVIPIRNTFFNSHPAANRLAASPGDFLSSLLPNIIVIAGLIFFLLILFSGFSLIVGAGKQKNPQDAARAHSALTYGVAGFLLVVTAYFILQIVGAVLGIDFTANWTF